MINLFEVKQIYLKYILVLYYSLQELNIEIHHWKNSSLVLFSGTENFTLPYKTIFEASTSMYRANEIIHLGAFVELLHSHILCI